MGNGSYCLWVRNFFWDDGKLFQIDSGDGCMNCECTFFLLYTFHVYSAFCQSYLNKTGIKKKPRPFLENMLVTFRRKVAPSPGICTLFGPQVLKPLSHSLSHATFSLIPWHAQLHLLLANLRPTEHEPCILGLTVHLWPSGWEPRRGLKTSTHIFRLSWLPGAPGGSRCCRTSRAPGLWAGPALSLTLRISTLRNESPWGKLRVTWTQ